MEKARVSTMLSCFSYGTWLGTSCEKFSNELGWESLNKQRLSRRRTLFYKITNNLTPDYTKDSIPSLHQPKYLLCNQDVFGKIILSHF